MTRQVDVAIIGAGPVGLFAIFALGQAGLTAVVIDALLEVGGQCTALYPDKPIYDIPGRTAVSAGALVADLMAQAEPFAPTFRLGCSVNDIVDAEGRFILHLSDGTSLEAGAVIVAAGAGAFGPNRPPLSGIEAFEQTSVYYSVKNPQDFRGQRVIIAGGGDSAADWAVVLASIAEHVTIVHRRAKFRASPATMSALEQLAAERRITIAAPRALHGLHGSDGRISAIALRDEDDAVETVPADALLCFFGLAKDLSAIQAWGLETKHQGIPVDSSTMGTRRPGIFAIGDVALYQGKLKLILTGFAEAALAAHSTLAHLRPDQTIRFEYSTTRGRPGIGVGS